MYGERGVSNETERSRRAQVCHRVLSGVEVGSGLWREEVRSGEEQQ